MLTPAMRASRTSAPPVIIANAVSTQVLDPPFLNLWPLLEATTTGLTLFGVITVGDWRNRVLGIAAAAAPAAAVVWTNWRRFNFLPILPLLPVSPSSLDVGEHVGGDNHTLRFRRPLIDFRRPDVAEEAFHN